MIIGNRKKPCWNAFELCRAYVILKEAENFWLKLEVIPTVTERYSVLGCHAL
jgi:hypothetical protein